jgi:FtsP/CotA-like multicopper oxidase with cupredoxin domain
MHLHGHHIHVVSKNGKPLEGSPLVLDTLLIEPGETYEVAFTANNPGLWMDHCHNLEHAASGMTMHLAYQNVVSPYSIGGEHGNHPE